MLKYRLYQKIFAKLAEVLVWYKLCHPNLICRFNNKQWLYLYCLYIVTSERCETTELTGSQPIKNLQCDTWPYLHKPDVIRIPRLCKWILWWSKLTLNEVPKQDHIATKWENTRESQGHSKLFTTGQAKLSYEHYVIKCVGGWYNWHCSYGFYTYYLL